MRAVLALALVLFAMTLALDHARELFPRAGAVGPADRALELVLGAKGPLLPAARIGSGPERIGEAMRIGDRTLVGDGGAGLRAAFLGPDLALRAERRYDVASSPSDRSALAAAVAGARDGEVVLLASSGSLAPPSDDARQELARTLARLGARAEIGTTTPESWALLAVRGERGWVPLAEGYSTESGVALAFVLGTDLERYADFRGDFVRVRAGERREVELAEELASAHARSDGATLARERAVQGQPLAGLLVPPTLAADGTAQPGRVVWDGVELGTGSCVFAFLGLADGAAPDSDGVVFEVLADGELVDRQVVLPGARWKPKLFDLRRFAGRKVTLELVVDPRASATGDAALWGRPLLLHGYDRNPLEIWAEER
jgi:hypothetical protein